MRVSYISDVWYQNIPAGCSMAGPSIAGPFEAGPFISGPFEAGPFIPGPFEDRRFVGVPYFKKASKIYNYIG